MDRTALPPLDLVGPDGRRLTLRALDRDDTVGSLAQRLDAHALWTSRELDPDERLVDVDDLRVGTRLGSDAPTGATPSDLPPIEVAVVTGPSSSSWRSLGAGRHLVGRAPHAGIRIDDPALEPYHALLIVDADGSVDAIQLSGTVPMRVGGRPLVDSVVDEETRLTMGASSIRIRRRRTDRCEGAAPGEPDLPAEPRGSLAAHPHDPWRRLVWRAPHDPPRWRAEPVTAPIGPVVPGGPSSTGLIGSAVTAIGAVIVATAMGNPMFVLFAGVGVIATVVAFAVGAVTTRRSARCLRARHSDRLVEFAGRVEDIRLARIDHHSRRHRSMHETLEVTHDLDESVGTRVWQRRAGTDEAALRGVVGTGTHRWTPPIEVPEREVLDGSLLQLVERCAHLVDVPTPLTIRPGDTIAFHGPSVHASSVARAIVVQLATWVGPSDWQLVVVSSDPRRWSWTDWLPHGALADGAFVGIGGGGGNDERLAAGLDAIDALRRTVLLTDEPHLFAARTGPLRRFLTASDAAALVVVDTDATVPAICRRILTLGSTGSATWSGDVVDGDDAVGIAFSGISLATADAVARRLACLVDPEDDRGAGGGVPASVSFADLHADISTDAIADRWRASGSDPPPVAPVGTSIDGRVDIDLVRDGPHALIAGTTGAGKSELLRTLVLSLAVSVAPDHLNFVLVDYKGGSTFDACVRLPHTVGLVTDLDGGLAERALVSLDAELHRRERLLRSVGASDLADYRSRGSDPVAPSESIARLVVVIDEFATLATDQPDFLSSLVGIAQRGRSLGVHLVLATQRPSGVVDDDIRANTNLRLALRLHDRADAVGIVGDSLPATFPRGTPGRSVLRLGPDELIVFQAARCTGAVVEQSADDGIIVERPAPHSREPGGDDAEVDPDAPSELEVAVESIIRAAAALGLSAPHRPWVEPLPFPLRLDPDGDDQEVAAPTAPTIGWIDDPQRQRRLPLSWAPSDGSLALSGSIGSGTTSTLIAIAAATCVAVGPGDLHLYVIDARGDDGLMALASVAHCAAVVRLTEDERLHRLLRRVVESIDRRIATGGRPGAEPELVVMIDGYGSLRASLGRLGRESTYDLLQRVVNDGPAVGIALVIADDGTGASAALPVAHRWVFHLDDPGVARGLGLRTAPVASGTPGRLRILGSGLEAQVAQGAAGLAALPSRADTGAAGPAPIATLADRISPADIGEVEVPDVRGPGDRVRLALGVNAADLGPASIDVHAGDHVLVVGGPRTGVSTALARVVAAWESDARRRGEPFRIVRVDRRSATDLPTAADPSARLAIVIDDAHRVDDPGVLAEIVAGDHDHVTVLAGGRADAIRTSYGHWTRDVARSRCGIVMASRGEPDGDLLAVEVPRRPLVPARPGLAWVVDGGALRQVQIAVG